MIDHRRTFEIGAVTPSSTNAILGRTLRSNNQNNPRRNPPQMLLHPPDKGLGITVGFHCTGISVLFDSGSGVSLMEHHLATKIEAYIETMTREQTRNILSADGRPMDLVGYARAALVIGPAAYPHKFYVRNQPSTGTRRSVDLIVGCDLFAKIGICNIDFGRKTITIKNPVTKLECAYQIDQQEMRCVIRTNAGEIWKIGGGRTLAQAVRDTMTPRTGINRESGITENQNQNVPMTNEARNAIRNLSLIPTPTIPTLTEEPVAGNSNNQPAITTVQPRPTTRRTPSTSERETTPRNTRQSSPAIPPVRYPTQKTRNITTGNNQREITPPTTTQRSTTPPVVRELPSEKAKKERMAQQLAKIKAKVDKKRQRAKNQSQNQLESSESSSSSRSENVATIELNKNNDHENLSESESEIDEQIQEFAEMWELYNSLNLTDEENSSWE